jgi:broad specificity phosphatase PhoE
MKLIIVRHGETEANVKELIMGQTNDPLTPRGAEQARKVGLRLKDEKIDRIYVSDLQRTMDTAKEIIKHHPDSEIIYEPLLREGHGGIFEGQPYGSMSRAAEKAGIPRNDFRPEGGESYSDVRERVRKFMGIIMKADMDKTLLLVTHGGIISNIIMHLFSISDENIKNFLPPNTGVTIIELDFKNGHKVHTLNCVKHLL